MAEGSGLAEVLRRLHAVGLEAQREPLPEGGEAYHLRGRTFAHRHLIKQVGGRWLPEHSAWRIDCLKGLEALAAALEAAGSERGLAEAPPKPFEAAPNRHYHGHRQRLRDRFMNVSPEALADYELLELLLFFSIYRRDTKPVAKALLQRFGGLGGVLAADPAQYRECFGLDPERLGEDHPRRPVYEDDLRFTQVLLKAVHETLRRTLREQVLDRPVIGSWTALMDYLKVAMSHEPREHFRILFLDRKNILIRDEVQSRGTVDHTPLYPREVVRRALELGASAIIMVHNHPSGDPTPSKADIEMTRQVVQALAAVNVTVHDHVVIGKNQHASFRSLRLI